MTTTTAIRPLNTDREIRRWAREDARRRKQTVTSKATRKMLRGDW